MTSDAGCSKTSLVFRSQAAWMGKVNDSVDIRSRKQKKMIGAGTAMKDSIRFRSIGRICTRIYPDMGGPAKHALCVSKEQNENGYRNHVVACRNAVTGRIDKEPWVHSIPIRAPVESSNLLSQLLFAISYLFLSTIWAIIIFARARVTLIHAHSPSIAGIVGIITAKVLGLPLVYTVHGLSGPALPWKQGRGSLGHLLAEHLVLRLSSMVMIVSKDYVPYIKTMTHESKIISIINGIDTKRFHPAEDELQRESTRLALGAAPSDIVLMWVGNFNQMEKVEGVNDSIRALKLVVKNANQSVRLFLVGDGMYSNEVRKIIRNLNLETKTVLVGYKTNISAVLKAADVFILVSHHEGFPNALLEAMATRLPCIVTNVGSIPEIVGDTSLVVPVGDIEAIARAIQYLAANPETREELARKAASRVEGLFTWNHAAMQQIDAYGRMRL